MIKISNVIIAIHKTKFSKLMSCSKTPFLNLGIKLPGDFANRWYATTFLGPFLMPFSSMLSLSTIRTELFYCIPRIKRPEKRLPVEAFVTTVPRVSVLSVTNSEYRRS